METVLKKIFQALAIGVVAVVLVSVGIDAVDHHDNMSESIAGRLLFGGSDGPCPEAMVFVSTADGGFCIDEYEASPSDECPYSPVNSLTATQDNLDIAGCLPVSRPESVPWTNISQNQAARACAKAGKRLPTNKEWQAAALGTPDAEDPGRDDCQTDSNWREQPGLTGSGGQCVSYAGCYDMIGNVWEWTDGAVSGGRFNDRELPEEGYVTGVNEADGLPSGTAAEADELYFNDYLWLKKSGNRAMARGGYWSNGAEAGQYSAYIVFEPSSSGPGVGFRCVK